MADIERVDLEDDYMHVRFNDPERYETIRTLDWAADVAQSVSSGAEVRTVSDPRVTSGKPRVS